MICNYRKPNFKRILNIANYILLSSEYTYEFPYSIKKLIKENSDIKCISYSKANKHGVNIEDFGSHDAILMKLDSKEIIFYNDKIKNKQRIRFSLAHEFGHKVLNHNFDSKENYSLYEIEANFFSAQLLMPEQIIYELINRGQQITVNNLIKWFNVSSEAAKKRINTLHKIDYINNNYDEVVMNESLLYKFQPFINSIAPINYNCFNCYNEEELQEIRDSWELNRL